MLFPTLPTDGQEVVFSQRTYVWSAVDTAWGIKPAAAIVVPITCTVTTTTPTSPGVLYTGETASIQFTFSESVTGFDATGVSVTNGTLSNFAGNGASYTATFTPTSTSRNEYTAVIKALPNVCAALSDSSRRNLESTSATINLYLQLMATPGLNGNGAYLLNTTQRTFTLTITPAGASALSGFALADVTLDLNNTGSATGAGTTATFATVTANSAYTFKYTPPASTTGYVDVYVKAGAFTGTVSAVSQSCDAGPRLRLYLLTAGIVPVITKYFGFGTGTNAIGAGLVTLKIALPVPRANVRTAVNDFVLADITVTPSNVGTLSNLRAFPGDLNSYLVDYVANASQSGVSVSFSMSAGVIDYELPAGSGSYYSNAVTGGIACTITSSPITFSSATPANGATNVQASNTQLTFNRSIGAIDITKIVLRSGATYISGTNEPFSASFSGAVLTVTPTNGFALSGQYWIEVLAGGVTDTFNNALAADLTPIGWTMSSTTVGHALFTSPGTYTWVCPANVYFVSVVGVGNGGSIGDNCLCGTATGYWGGGGAGLTWRNDIPVTPGTSYTVYVGSSGGANGSTVFINSRILYAENGGTSGTTTRSLGGRVSGTINDGLGAGTGTFGGGDGGLGSTSAATNQGSGGAGGYAGAGGNGATKGSNSAAGAGGGGGGGSGITFGGGVGLYGQGASGAGFTGDASDHNGNPGSNGTGSTYGGGGSTSNAAVRILWGPGRAFPSTNVASQFA